MELGNEANLRLWGGEIIVRGWVCGEASMYDSIRILNPLGESIFRIKTAIVYTTNIGSLVFSVYAGLNPARKCELSTFFFQLSPSSLIIHERVYVYIIYYVLPASRR